MDKFRFGNKICELREKNGLTQRALAHMLGVTDKAVSKWENAQSVPRFEKLEKMAQIFDVPVETFLGDATESFDVDKERSRLIAQINKEKNSKIISTFISTCIFVVLLPFLFSLLFKFLSHFNNNVEMLSRIESVLLSVALYSLVMLTVIIFLKTVSEIYTQVKNEILVRNSEIIACANNAITPIMAIHHLTAIIAMGPALALLINDYSYLVTIMLFVTSLILCVVNTLTQKYANASVFLTDKGFFNESIEKGEFVLYKNIENVSISNKAKKLSISFIFEDKKYDLTDFKTDELEKVFNYFKA